MSQLKALICSYLNLTPEIPDAELYDSIKDKVNELSNTSTTENIANQDHTTVLVKGGVWLVTVLVPWLITSDP